MPISFFSNSGEPQVCKLVIVVITADWERLGGLYNQLFGASNNIVLYLVDMQDIQNNSIIIKFIH